MGGRVVEVLPCVVREEPRVWINVRGTGFDRFRTLAVFVEDTYAARSVSEGDSLWWQGGHAFWTPKPKDGSPPPFSDWPFRRIGFSGVARPHTPAGEPEGGRDA